MIFAVDHGVIQAAHHMAFIDSQKAKTFSVPIRWNSRRSRALGFAPAAIMRAVR
jgi:hypothetical protein